MSFIWIYFEFGILKFKYRASTGGQAGLGAATREQLHVLYPDEARRAPGFEPKQTPIGPEGPTSPGAALSCHWALPPWVYSDHRDLAHSAHSPT